LTTHKRPRLCKTLEPTHRPNRIAREIGEAAAATLARADAYIAERIQLIGLGITAHADTQDGAWVQIEFPISTDPDSSRKALMLGAVQMIVEKYGGQRIDAQTVRQSEAQAYSHLNLLDALMVAVS